MLRVQTQDALSKMEQSHEEAMQEVERKHAVELRKLARAQDKAAKKQKNLKDLTVHVEEVQMTRCTCDYLSSPVAVSNPRLRPRSERKRNSTRRRPSALSNSRRP